MAHISYLNDKNKIKIIVKNNKIYYKTVWFKELYDIIRLTNK
jgi:hypothetical protein